MNARMRLVAAVCGAIAATAAAPAAAHAGLVVPPANDCPEQTAVSPFAPWNDHAGYVRVDDGGFDHGAAGWTLRRAQVVAENQPWPVEPPDEPRALQVRGSATTPSFCVGLGHPTIRFFARNAGSPLGALLVEVVVTTSLGPRLALPIGIVANGRRWAPTPRILMIANLLTLEPGEQTRVSFRFTAIGIASAWVIDDVYVDPYAKR